LIIFVISHFKVHQFFHNFAGLIVVIILSASANHFNINIRYLKIPASFSPTGVQRTQWFIDPLRENEVWTVFLAIIPATILALTVFIEQQLCARFINHQHNLLKVFFS